MSAVQSLLMLAFPALVIVGGLTDAATFTIPNRISLALAGLYFVAALICHQPLIQFAVTVAVGFVALIAGMGMFAAGWIGGGDAKLFAASALWLGLPGVAPFLLVTALAGGALAVILLNARSAALKPYFASAPAWFARLVTPGAGVPYGVAIAVGALVAYPHGVLMGGAPLHF